MQPNICYGLAIVFSIIVVAMEAHRYSPPPVLPLAALILAIPPLCIWGCAAYAKSKGYHELWGLLGLAGCFGLLILFLMPYQ